VKTTAALHERGNNVFIECPRCTAKVDANVLGEKVIEEDGGDPEKVVLLECTVCKSPLLGFSSLVQTSNGEYDWLNATRLWPEAAEVLHESIPSEVRGSLRDANRCFDARVFSATAVMAGRAIEALCKDKVGSKMTLARGLQQLKDQGLIDDKIVHWANALREQRNLGAHATGVDVNEQDARDVLDFANAICEYVYVLAQKYEAYMARRPQR
jgi:hypothetical protein